MKVVQILPELNAGGVERGTLEVAQYLVEHGHEAVVISNGGRLVAPLEAMGARHLALPVHRKRLGSLRQVRPLRQLLENERPDILHARSRIPAWLAWLAWRKLQPASRPGFVTTVHGAHSVSPYSAIMTRGERVIAVSEFIRSYIVQNYPKTPLESIRLIHRGVDPEAFPFGYQPDETWLSHWNETYPQLREKRILTIVGRMTRLKGHERFIQLINALSKRFEDVAGLVVGSSEGRDPYVKEMKQLAESLGLSDRIVFTGQRSDVREIYAISTVVLSLSTKSESFGRTVLEPLSLGIPALGYDRGGVGEILRALYPSGAIKADDPHVLEEAAVRLLTSPPEPVKRNETFLLSAMLAKTLNLYEELAACRSSS